MQATLSKLLDTLAIYTQRRVITMLLLGFSSGLPFMLIFSSLSFWLREAGVDRASITLLSLTGLAFAFKFLWSPLVDKIAIPTLSQKCGQRRSWLLLCQLTILSCFLLMALQNPLASSGFPLEIMATLAVIAALSAATQDIVIDAYRIEMAEPELQGAMAAMYIGGYRVAIITGGAGTLGLAAWFSGDLTGYQYTAWQSTYLVMGSLMVIGVITTLLMPEPVRNIDQATVELEQKSNAVISRYLPGSSLLKQIITIFVSAIWDFIKRYGWQAVVILLLIGSYRIADIVMGVIANVFYVDMGFTKSEVATISKVYGVIMTLAGAALGGFIIKYVGVIKVLFIGAFMSAVTNLLFAALAHIGHDTSFLIFTISLDNLSSGLAQVAFIAYLSSLTNVSFSATQYALFSSLMLLFPKLIGGGSGWIVNQIGYSHFFTFTAILGIPVLVLVVIAGRVAPPDTTNKQDTDANSSLPIP
ncbi:AmpG family muropeptide MFS transporter [Spartinivicinus poritis]|uniref:MFS transporter n=1 Tax=Spartinivicinus poritis TaxID=2994640 RepID=A0ABT5U8Y3_9GAMM|nr:MFS transporter [Spartinivicinus sp. A2-2]MDE1462834.1 MFS transporter [Spartinivicinus sp. A2-2]